jgi:prolyl oligopeptidase
MRLAAAWISLIVSPALLPAQAPPPETAKHPVTDVLNGVTLTDSYRWLEDQNSPATRAWIESQTKHTRAMLDPLPQRAALKLRISALMRTEQMQLPRERGGKYFFERRAAGDNRASICMRRSLHGPDEVLVDPNTVSKDETVSVEIQDVTPDGKLLAYSVRQGGADEFEVHFLNVESKTLLPDRIAPASFDSVDILPDHSGVYLSEVSPAGPRVLFRVLGSDRAEPVQIFGQGYSPSHIAIAHISEDGRYLVINVVEGASGDNAEIWLLDRAKGGRPAPVVRRDAGRAFGMATGGRLYIMSNWNAPRGRLFQIDPERPQRHFWKLVVPESPWNMEGFDVAGGKLLVTYTKNAANMLMLYEAEGRFLQEIELPGIGSVYGTSSRWGSNEAFLSFASFATPPSVLRLDLATHARETWFRSAIPINSADFEEKQVLYPSRDGTPVPMFIAHRKGLTLNGANPTLLTGYGGFGVSSTPYFWPAGVAWMEQGGVIALACLRGGAEFGEEWHRAGMLDKKQNVFDDFIAAAEALVRWKYTSPSKLAIEGGSNGGLLVGAVMVQRPELFRAVVCEVPLLDMIRYQHFLVAKLWVPEYGSSEDPKQFEYLLRYSPYQNVKDGVKYPAVLFLTGDSDTRVAPLHARKMTARVQAASKSGLPVLLLYDTKTGHSGGKPVSQAIEDDTDVLSFLSWQLGAGAH